MVEQRRSRSGRHRAHGPVAGREIVRVFLLSLGLLGTRAAVVSAQEAADSAEHAGLAELLVGNRYPLVFEAGSMTGAGADLLLAEARNADFLLLGEDHGTAEIPAFAGALFHALAPAGYRHFAIETSPLVASTLEAMVRAGRRDTILEFAQTLTTPLEIPFYTLHEEARLLHDVVRDAAGRSNVLWGLDQEFIASSPGTLAWLAEQAPDAQARAVAEDLREQAVAGIDAARAGDFSRIFLIAADDATWSRLEAAFRTAEQASDVIAQMRRSAEIYLLFYSGSGYQSNMIREQLLKRNFMRSFRKAEASDGDPGKVMLKLGAAHLSRGQKLITDDFSLGNFISEFATSRNGSSFHVMVISGKGGKAAGAGPDLTFQEGDAEGATSPWAQPFVDAAHDHGWTVFDIRPLRPALSEHRIEAPGVLGRIVWGYDAVVVIPGTTASGF